jgi:hypothetical protein
MIKLKISMLVWGQTNGAARTVGLTNLLMEALGENGTSPESVPPDTAQITESIPRYPSAVAARRPKHFKRQALFPHIASSPGRMLVTVFLQILGGYAPVAEDMITTILDRLPLMVLTTSRIALGNLCAFI